MIARSIRIRRFTYIILMTNSGFFFIFKLSMFVWKVLCGIIGFFQSFQGNQKSFCADAFFCKLIVKDRS